LQSTVQIIYLLTGWILDQALAPHSKVGTE
jgi:hypothetical protein